MIKGLLVWLGVVGLVTGGVYTVSQYNLEQQQARALSEKISSPTLEEAKPKPKKGVKHVQIPAAVKAVYMSQCAASSLSFREYFKSLVADTELNTIIIDIKDYTGTVAFVSDNPQLSKVGQGCVVNDMKDFIKELHDDGIYVIGRITVFQDPAYAALHPDLAVKRRSNPQKVWKDHKGLAFIDVGAEPFWDYIVAISKEAFLKIGFDELNYDYVRYPSDGNMADTLYTHSIGTKAEQLEKFFAYLTEKVRQPDIEGRKPILSADLFGMTTTNFDDLTIGQVLERAMPYFDYLSPMVYPSHYPAGFNGYANPNKNVYGVVNFSMTKAVERAEAETTTIPSLRYEKIILDPDEPMRPTMYKKPSYPRTMLRPWLQDFDYGGNYGPTEVKAQIQATYDAGLDSWLLWNASNKYTKEALL